MTNAGYEAGTRQRTRAPKSQNLNETVDSQSVEREEGK